VARKRNPRHNHLNAPSAKGGRQKKADPGLDVDPPGREQARGGTALRPNGLSVPSLSDRNAIDEVLRGFFPGLRPERAGYLVNFSVKHRFLYLETPKVACTSIKRALQVLEGVDLTGDGSVHDRDRSPLMAPYDSLADFLVAQHDPRWVRFSFVRNPFTRILSGYLDKVISDEVERVRLLPELGLSADKVPSLEDFLVAIKRQNVCDLDIHWLPQSEILCGFRAPHFIGRFENFDSDAGRVFPLILGEKAKDLGVHAPHATGASRLVHEYVGRIEARLIADIYRADFESYGYSVDPRFA
jgi:hypothetical protein